IIALNEEQRVGGCLDSVRGLTDDIVVVDAESRDRTGEICRAKAARVFQRRWTGFSEQKNFGNARARYDWILSLDADEQVTPELAASIRRAFAHGPPSRDAYTIRFQNYYGGRQVRFGAWNPEWHVRLFDRRKCDWNSDEVHEGLRGVEGCEFGRLQGCIRHLTANSREELAAKTQRYSELFAVKLRRSGRVPGWAKVWLNPAWRFGRDFFLRLGVLDGAAGWAIAWEAARYTHLKYWRALPDPRPRRRVQWLAPGAATAMLVAMLSVMPENVFRGLRAGAEPHAKAGLQISIPNQTAGSISLLNSDDGDLLYIRPHDDVEVLD
ncbi:MAG: glycosyltransferase family 2 protein, partial [Verrucomicrobia bacterium]|nr:glycosyltransferase family 2 protein [Verrucomicrobiota bacterium]